MLGIGVAMMQSLSPGQLVHQVWTDASGHIGCGAVYPASLSWLQLPWPHHTLQGAVHLQEESILLHELLPVILPCAVWGPIGRGASVVVHCDNLGAVVVVNLGYSKVPKVMHLLHCLFLIRGHFNFSVWAVHVSGVQNGWADVIPCN